MPRAKFLLCERELDGEPGSNSSRHIHPEWSCPFPGETGAAPREPERLGASASADKAFAAEFLEWSFFPRKLEVRERWGPFQKL